MSVTHDPIRFWAVLQPGRMALKSERHEWSYAELEAAVAAASQALLARGLGAGEHVALEFPPEEGALLAITLHAAHRLGLLPVLIPSNATQAERELLRAKAQTDFILTAEGIAKPAAAAAAADAAIADDGAPPLRRLDAPAAVVFTSGTSASPRAAVLTHGNLLWSAVASGRNLGVVEGDRWLCCMPLHHVGGLSIVTRCAAYGIAAAFHARFDADAVNHAIDHEGITLLSLVPTMLSRLLKARGGRPFPSRFRAALIGGGPVAPALLEEAAALRLPALPTYGLTEATSQVTTLSPREWPAGLASAGRPLPFVRVEIRDESDRALPPGEEGEIVVRGPIVMAGYLGEPEATAEELRGRWLRTGDTGTWDEEGRLVVLDRRADRIVTGGENVSPAEVERVLATHPGVADVCVVGLPSSEWGQEVAALIEVKPGVAVTMEGLRAHAAATLASFKLPRHVMIVSALPRSAGGKLLRRVARERFLDEVAKQKHP
ncbi:MAG TPA: AMP-binding protein [Candidatus Eisenbacteria bacterium]|nr:AMP-binding protein [Candidatus Eisenbacteria bacterium]